MLREKAPAFKAHSAATVVADVDGLVRGMVGGRDYGANQFNRATDAARQPGSSFKIFVYMTALMTGKFHPNSLVNAGGICIGDYCVHNYHGESGGMMPMTTALAQSFNTAAIWLSLKIGEAYWPAKQSYHEGKIASLGRSKIVETARKMGLTTPLVDTVSLPVGADEVKMIDMVGANAMLANGGKRATPYAAIEIRNSAGKLIYTHDANGTPARPGAAGRQGRRDEQFDDPRRHRGHGTGGADPRPHDLRQDRHHQQLDQCLVQRLHRQHGLQRLVRQRRQFADRRHDRRHAAGRKLARHHGLCASGPRRQAALWRRAAAGGRGSRSGQSGRQFPIRAARPRPYAESRRNDPLDRRFRGDGAKQDSGSRGARRNRAMKTLVKALLAAMAALALGLWVTQTTLKDGGPFDIVEIGPWRIATRAGALDADPYTRAGLEQRGEIPLALGEGLQLVARKDEDGRALDPRCTYSVAPHAPPARYWSLELVDLDGFPIENPAERYVLRSSEVLRNSDGTFVIWVSPAAHAGNWLPIGAGRPFALVMRLYDSPISATAGVDNAAAPKIRREACA